MTRTFITWLLNLLRGRRSWNFVIDSSGTHCEDLNGNWLDERGNIDPQVVTRVYGGGFEKGTWE